MIALLEIYWLNILLGTATASVLAVYGAHVVARGRAVESLAIGQSATVGVLLGAWLTGGGHESGWAHLICPTFGVLIALCSQRAVAHMQGKFISAPSAPFVCLFVLMLAAAYLLTSVLPGLESHLAQAFFGDLVTLSGLELGLTATVMILSAILFFLFSKDFLLGSFMCVVFADNANSLRKADRIFELVTLSLIAVSIFTLGLLFTLAALLLPTTILVALGSEKMSFRNHFIGIAISASLGALLGFIASLHWDRLPTVPTIVIMIFIIGIACSRVGRASR